MSKRRIFIYSGLLLLVLITWILLDRENKIEEFPERVKIALREVGNQLLLQNGNTTSLVLPVVALEDSLYALSFEHILAFEPGTLVSIMGKTFAKANLPAHYIVEVFQCSDREVAYSYQMSAEKEQTIIPCSGRLLPEACYTIQVRFIDNETAVWRKQIPRYLFVLILFILLTDVILQKRKSAAVVEDDSANFKLGIFKFYPEQHKLVKEMMEINLSKKECELLAIFVANPNKIIKRDELTKKVWEDNGVFVGRSLDTYISKLRKKLKEDVSIKLTNVHGVGYKLEMG